VQIHSLPFLVVLNFVYILMHFDFRLPATISPHFYCHAISAELPITHSSAIRPYHRYHRFTPPFPPSFHLLLHSTISPLAARVLHLGHYHSIVLPFDCRSGRTFRYLLRILFSAIMMTVSCYISFCDSSIHSTVVVVCSLFLLMVDLFIPVYLFIHSFCCSVHIVEFVPIPYGTPIHTPHFLFLIPTLFYGYVDTILPFLYYHFYAIVPGKFLGFYLSGVLPFTFVPAVHFICYYGMFISDTVLFGHVPSVLPQSPPIPIHLPPLPFHFVTCNFCSTYISITPPTVHFYVGVRFPFCCSRISTLPR